MLTEVRVGLQMFWRGVLSSGGYKRTQWQHRGNPDNFRLSAQMDSTIPVTICVYCLCNFGIHPYAFYLCGNGPTECPSTSYRIFQYFLVMRRRWFSLIEKFKWVLFKVRKITVTQCLLYVYIYTCNYGLLRFCLYKKSERSTLTDLSKCDGSVVMSGKRCQ